MFMVKNRFNSEIYKVYEIRDIDSYQPEFLIYDKTFNAFLYKPSQHFQPVDLNQEEISAEKIKEVEVSDKRETEILLELGGITNRIIKKFNKWSHDNPEDVKDYDKFGQHLKESFSELLILYNDLSEKYLRDGKK